MKNKKITLASFVQSRVGKWADVYLISGIRLSGEIVSYDHEALFIRGAGEVPRPLQMILLSAISTVSTQEENGRV